MSKAQELFTARVRALLDEKRWTYMKLGEKTGLSTGAISRYIKGKQVPGLNIVDRIAEAFGIEGYELLLPPDSDLIKKPPSEHSVLDCMRTVRDLLKDLDSEGDENTPLMKEMFDAVDKRTTKKKKR